MLSARPSLLLHERQINDGVCCPNVTEMTMRRSVRALICGVAGLFAAAPTIAPAAAGPQTVGVHHGWAAFRDDAPPRCYAIAAPENRIRGAFASVGAWPARGVSGQVHVRFHRPARAGSAVVLTIGDSLFQLVARGEIAWARSPTADRAIIAAMRTGVAMTVRARDENGGAMAFQYALNGAATAIDAAMLACRPGA